MSWLLFLDESGHDHKTCPYEVRGGVALHAGKLWPFVQQLQQAELAAFGARLHEYRKELKGAKLLDKDRFKWAAQGDWMTDEARRKHCRGFLTKGLEKLPPSRDEFTAYGQACIEMARSVFQALRTFEAQLFASAIPVTAEKPATFEAEEYLRKDHVFLLERYFYFLEAQQEHGLLVFDEVEKVADRRFVRQMERYFTKTQTGRYRAAWIVPVPMFVSSDLSMPVQAADLAIYCVNWGSGWPASGWINRREKRLPESSGHGSASCNTGDKGIGREESSTPTASTLYPIPTATGDEGGKKEKEIKPAKPPRAKPPSDRISTADYIPVATALKKLRQVGAGGCPGICATQVGL